MDDTRHDEEVAVHMSTSLYWRPVPVDPSGTSLPYGLKKAVARRFWDHDGSLYGDPAELTADDLPYLEGVRDGGGEEVAAGAQQLIDAIEKHGRVEIFIAG